MALVGTTIASVIQPVRRLPDRQLDPTSGVGGAVLSSTLRVGSEGAPAPCHASLPVHAVSTGLPLCLDTSNPPRRQLSGFVDRRLAQAAPAALGDMHVSNTPWCAEAWVAHGAVMALLLVDQLTCSLRLVEVDRTRRAANKPTLVDESRTGLRIRLYQPA